MEDIAPHFQYVFNRLNKLEGALKNICRRNTELEIANEKLRKEHDTWEQREAARERILKNAYLKLSEQQLQEVGDPTTDGRTDESDQTGMDARTSG